jgi:hypothetical protein
VNCREAFYLSRRGQLGGILIFNLRFIPPPAIIALPIRQYGPSARAGRAGRGRSTVRAAQSLSFTIVTGFEELGAMLDIGRPSDKADVLRLSDAESRGAVGRPGAARHAVQRQVISCTSRALK